MIKCLDYNTYSVLCQGCDILSDVKCAKNFNFNIPMSAISKDSYGVIGEYCPVCMSLLNKNDTHDNLLDLRCDKCGQMCTTGAAVIDSKKITLYLSEEYIPEGLEIIRTLAEVEVAIKNGVPIINTTQPFVISTENMLKGYSLKVILLDGEEIEIKLGPENKYTKKDIRLAHNLERMLLANAFGYARDIPALEDMGITLKKGSDGFFHM